MKLNVLTVLYLIFLLTSCNSESEPAIITMDPAIRQVGPLVLNNAVDMRYDFLQDRNEILIENDLEVVELPLGRSKKYIYLEPGARVEILSGDRGQLRIISSSQTEQNLLEEFEKQLSIAANKFNLQELASTEPEVFLQKLDTKYDAVEKLIENANEVSSDLKNILAGRIAADKVSNGLNYPTYYEYINKTSPTLPEDFYSFTEELDLENEKLFYFQDVIYSALSLLGKDIVQEDMDEFYRETYNLVGSGIKNAKIKEVLQFNILNDKVNGSAGAGSLGTEIDAFLSSAKDTTKVNVLRQAVAQWAHLQKGLDAPEFSGFTSEGSEVKIADFKGKNVYIDVWATWCGPCIAEIPFLKAMEEEYKEENVEFVSVSIDAQKDRQKWEQMVVSRELGGTQIMVRGDWKSEITSKYNIMSIPRFIMIDKNGKMLNAQAPRPSNKEAFKKMLAEVL